MAKLEHKHVPVYGGEEIDPHVAFMVTILGCIAKRYGGHITVTQAEFLAMGSHTHFEIHYPEDGEERVEVTLIEDEDERITAPN